MNGFNHIIIKEHTDYCIAQRKYNLERYRSMQNQEWIAKINDFEEKEILVFLYDSIFYIVELPSCNMSGNRPHEFIAKMIKKAINGKIVNYSNSYYEIITGDRFIDKFSRYKYSGIISQEYVSELNYLYYNAAGKQYAVITNRLFTDMFFSNDQLELNYNNFCKYLDEIGYTIYKDEVSTLYFINRISTYNEIKIYNSIKEFSKLFLKQLKTKQNEQSHAS